MAGGMPYIDSGLRLIHHRPKVDDTENRSLYWSLGNLRMSGGIMVSVDHAVTGSRNNRNGRLMRGGHRGAVSVIIQESKSKGREGDTPSHQRSLKHVSLEIQSAVGGRWVKWSSRSPASSRELERNPLHRIGTVCTRHITTRWTP